MKQTLAALGIPATQIFAEVFESPRGGGTPAMSADVVAVYGKAVITFARSGRQGDTEGLGTVLEAAEEAGVAVPFECRSGICGTCKVKLLEGKVNMPVRDALSANEEQAGLILACQAQAVGDISVDA